MSSPPNITEINRKRAQNGQPPLDIPVLDAEEVQKKGTVKEIHHHYHGPEDNGKVINGHINRIALARYLFPLCAGTFTGAIVNQVYGIIWSMALSLLFVAIVGFVLAYDNKENEKL
jgi:hypothetical protein